MIIMKILKIVELLFAVCLMNNVYSIMMEPTQDGFAVERQFLEGTISLNGYLSYLANLSGEYAYKIRAMLNARAITPEGENLEEEFLGVLEEKRATYQKLKNQRSVFELEETAEELRTFMIRFIDAFYQELEKDVDVRHGREA